MVKNKVRKYLGTVYIFLTKTYNEKTKEQKYKKRGKEKLP